ncbi:hypothetical protein SAMN05660860_01179 [Geoalkalibacter ferrihydriticus]|uniref:Uncharacterized protein n=1 Tax=Geoalkalibacter ferrihydriticus TaxID=392333 RepID=A0A1G9MKE1_9BACT|nr:hypothetical protein SAMN05660860_01179 [Geoalkalibacter ferrihydriticus]
MVVAVSAASGDKAPMTVVETKPGREIVNNFLFKSMGIEQQTAGFVRVFFESIKSDIKRLLHKVFSRRLDRLDPHGDGRAIDLSAVQDKLT